MIKLFFPRIENIALEILFLLFVGKLVDANQWTKISLSQTLSQFTYRAITWASSGNVFAAGAGDSGLIIRSTDNGISWSSVYAHSKPFQSMASKTINSGITYYMAIDTSRHVHVSNGTGTSWKRLISVSSTVYGVCIGHNGNAFIAGNDVIYKSNATLGYQKWKALTTGVSSASWLDVSSPDGTNVIAVGANGLVAYSLNGGITWAEGSSGTGSYIYCVSHGNSSSAMAAGNSGYLGKTIDGGGTWSNLTAFPSNFSAYYHSISMLSTREAYVAAQLSSGSPATSLVYRTLNGGDSWSLMTSTSMLLYSLSMSSSSYGVAGGATTGSGVLVLVPDPTSQPTTRQPSSQPTASNPLDVPTSFPSAFIEHGVWYEKEVGVSSDTYYGTACLPTYACVVVGTRLSDGIILATSNGGSTWSSKKLSLDPVYDVGCFEHNASSYFVATSDSGKVYVSLNDGVSWTSYTVGNVLYGIAIAKDGMGYVVGSSGKIAKASDSSGYSSWSYISLSGSDNPDLYDAVSFDGKTVYVVGMSGSIYRSVNGGSTWTALTSSLNTNDDIYSISSVSNTVLMLFGSSNFAAKSTNGGDSWSLMNITSTGSTTAANPAHAIQMLSPSVAYCGSANGYIYYTVNGGHNWHVETRVAVNIKQKVLSLNLYSTTVGVAGGTGFVFILMSSSQQSSQPTSQPTIEPTNEPTNQPSGQPSHQPSSEPSSRPSGHPSSQPTFQPIGQLSSQPTSQPSSQPTSQPSTCPSDLPTTFPSSQPTTQPSVQPSSQPSSQPSARPTSYPSSQPSSQPSGQPSDQPSGFPSCRPSGVPSSGPSQRPSGQPTSRPSMQPTTQPSQQPSSVPSSKPSGQPSAAPSKQPMACPTAEPSSNPSGQPSGQPSSCPSGQPSRQPTSQPSTTPSVHPSTAPSGQPSSKPTAQPSSMPSGEPTCRPSSSQPSRQPTSQPSGQPTRQPSSRPSSSPTAQPSSKPSNQQPTFLPTTQPSVQPSSPPTCQPRARPTSYPSSQPSSQPSTSPTGQPTNFPSGQPTSQPTTQPSPSSQPSGQPSARPTSYPSSQPSSRPSGQPSDRPSGSPSYRPSAMPSSGPSQRPSGQPTSRPSMQPTTQPSQQPFSEPSSKPSGQPSAAPSKQPMACPTADPSSIPSGQPSGQPSSCPAAHPVCEPSSCPTAEPSSTPAFRSNSEPSSWPSIFPVGQPISSPTKQPFSSPSSSPSALPSSAPSSQPSQQPISSPSSFPTGLPSCQPTSHPSSLPCAQPSMQPSLTSRKAIALQQAVFAANGSSVLVTMNQKTNLADIEGPYTFPCSRVLNFTKSGLYLCSWQTDRTLLIHDTFDSSLQVGFSLALQRNSHLSYSLGSAKEKDNHTIGDHSRECEVDIEAITISSPTVGKGRRLEWMTSTVMRNASNARIGMWEIVCGDGDDVVWWLDFSSAMQPSLSAGRMWHSMNIQILPFFSTSSSSSLISNSARINITSNKSSLWHAWGEEIYRQLLVRSWVILPVSPPRECASVQVVATMSNFLGQCQSLESLPMAVRTKGGNRSAIVTRFLGLSSADSIWLRANEELTIGAEAFILDCHMTLNPQQRQRQQSNRLHYVWQLYRLGDETDKFASSGNSGNWSTVLLTVEGDGEHVFVRPSRSLLPNHIYKLTLEVMDKEATTATSQTNSITIHVLPSPLIASIVPSEPEHQSQAINTSSIISLFVLDSSSRAAQRNGSASLEVKVVDASSPTLLSIPALSVAKNQKVNMDGDLTVWGIIQSARSCNGSWSVSGTGALSLGLMQEKKRAERAIATSSSSQLVTVSFSLPRQSPSSLGLLAGGNYLFRLACLAQGHQGRRSFLDQSTVSMTVAINKPPQGGRLSVWPSRGWALNTSFHLFTDMWLDVDLPLGYAYFMSSNPVFILGDVNKSQYEPNKVLMMNESDYIMLRRWSLWNDWHGGILPLLSTSPNSSSSQPSQHDANVSIGVQVLVRAEDGLHAKSCFLAQDVQADAPTPFLLEPSILNHSNTGMLLSLLNSYQEDRNGSLENMENVVSTIATTLNVLGHNCSGAPNCLVLHRSPCDSVKGMPNTCAGCLEGFLSLEGSDYSNQLCIPQSVLKNYSSHSRPCQDLNRSNCFPWQSCNSLTHNCVDVNKQCPSSTCSSHGRCVFLSSSNLSQHLTTCPLLSSSCQAQCLCRGDYGGPDCSTRKRDLLVEQDLRHRLVQALNALLSDTCYWKGSVDQSDNLRQMAKVLVSIIRSSYDISTSQRGVQYATVANSILLSAAKDIPADDEADQNKDEVMADLSIILAPLYSAVKEVTRNQGGNVTLSSKALLSIMEGALSSSNQVSVIYNDIRVTSEVLVSPSPSVSILVPIPLSDQEKLLASTGQSTLPSVSVTTNTSGPASVVVIVTSPSSWQLIGGNGSGNGTLISSVVSVKATNVQYVDVTIPTSSIPAPSPPITFTIQCPPRLQEWKNFTCTDSGTVLKYLCNGVAGAYQGACPVLRTTCTAFNVPGVAVPTNAQQCFVFNTTARDIICRCNLVVSNGAGYVATGLVMKYFGSDLTSTFQASSTITSASASALRKAYVVIALYGSLWAAAIVAIFYFAWNYQRGHQTKEGQNHQEKQKKKVAKILQIFPLMKQENNIQYGDEKSGPKELKAEWKKRWKAYVHSLLPAIFQEKGLFLACQHELWRHHEYFNFFFRLHHHSSPIVAVIEMITLQSFLLFLLALLYDLNYPDDDGSCIFHKTASECLTRKYMLNTKQSYCRWSGETNQCEYAEPSFSITTAIYISMIISFATCLVSEPLGMLMKLLTGGGDGRGSCSSHPKQNRRMFLRVRNNRVMDNVTQDQDVRQAMPTQASISPAERAVGSVIADGNNTADVRSQQKLRPRRHFPSLVEAAYWATASCSSSFLTAPPPYSSPSITIPSATALGERKHPRHLNDMPTTRIIEPTATAIIPPSDLPLPQSISSFSVASTMEKLTDELKRHRMSLMSNEKMLRDFDLAWGLDHEQGAFLLIAASHPPNNKSRVWSWWERRRSSSGRKVDVYAMVSQAVQEVHHIALHHHLPSLGQASNNMEKGYDIFFSFLLDLLGRDSLSARIFAMKMELEFEELPAAPAPLFLRLLVSAFILALNVFFIYFSILKGYKKGVAWQEDFLRQWMLQVLLDVLVFETLQCLWFHALIPRLAAKDVRVAFDALFHSVDEVADLQGRHDVDGRGRGGVNAADYLFVSHYLARAYPLQVESQLVLSYRNPLPGRAGLSWQEQLTSVEEAEEAEEGEGGMRTKRLSRREGYHHDNPNHPLLPLLSHSPALPPSSLSNNMLSSMTMKVMKVMALAPLRLQRMIIQVAEPGFLAAATLAFYFFAKQPIYLSIFAVVMVFLGVIIVRDSYRMRARRQGLVRSSDGNDKEEEDPNRSDDKEEHSSSSARDGHDERVGRADGEEEGEKEKASLLNEKDHDDDDDYNSEESEEEEDLYNLHKQRRGGGGGEEDDLWSGTSIALSSHSDNSSISSDSIDSTPLCILATDVEEDSSSSHSTSDLATLPQYKGLARLLSDSDSSSSARGSSQGHHMK
eukprot:scaffold2830_cov175-Ochromonas_danica.AAC.1